MNCKEVEHTITEITDFKALESLPAAIKTHLEHCDSCKQFYTVSLHLNDFIQERTSVDAESDFFTQVMSKVADKEKTHSIGPQTKFLRTSRSIAASIVFIMALGLGILAGKYSASTITNNSASSYQESSDVLGLIVADNSFNLLNFDE